MNKFFHYLLATTLILCTNACSKEDQLVSDIDTIEQYLNDNGLSAQKDNSGLFYTITNDGTGSDRPDENDIIEVEYEGRLLDGTVFDASQMDEALIFPLSGLLEGWKIGIPKLKKGGSMTLYIPSSLGYGENARTGIPANSILIFDIKLIDFADNQSDFDERKIVSYLAANNLTAERHDSGLYYQIEEPGSAEQPNASSEVLVNYKGYLMNGEVFDETGDNAISFGLANVINAWRIGVPLIGKGGKITIYSPSGLAYGTRGQNGIPANSILIFEIELKNFQ